MVNNFNTDTLYFTFPFLKGYIDLDASRKRVLQWLKWVFVELMTAVKLKVNYERAADKGEMQGKQKFTKQHIGNLWYQMCDTQKLERYHIESFADVKTTASAKIMAAKRKASAMISPDKDDDFIEPDEEPVSD